MAKQPSTSKSQQTNPHMAEIVWRDGVPVAHDYDDPCYSLAGGLEESRFVFLEGANTFELASSRDKFVIGETGFGTGLNFLATWQEWRDRQLRGRLIFVSTEAHPMAISDMEKAHGAFPEIQDLAQELRSALPPSNSGFHTRSFDDGKVTLLLLIGDAESMFAQLVGSIDAWFLDGFAPAKNPQMWTDGLFQQIARLSKTGSTLATFTAAGFVRRGLTEVGFHMVKTPGFARKRERLVGEFDSATSTGSSPEHLWAARPKSIEGKKVGIIGGGIAGAALSHELKKRNYNPIVISAHQPAGCSDIPAAIMAPRFVLENSAERAFFANAFAFSAYEAFQKGAFSSTEGVLYPAKSDQDKVRQKRIEKTYAWDKNWLELEEDGLHLPKGGTVDAAKWIAELIKDTPILKVGAAKIVRLANAWQVLDEDGKEIADFDQIVVAAGAQSPSILRASKLDYTSGQHSFPEVRFVGGQIEIVESASLRAIDPRTLCYGNYVSASVMNSGKQVRSIGATFDKIDNLQKFSTSSDASRCTILADFNEQFDVNVRDEDHIKSWSGVRSTTPDHLPYVGPIPQWRDLARSCAPMAQDAKKGPTHSSATEAGLYLLTGLGSKGFQYGPVLANYLAALIAGDPLPLSADMIAKLHPGRGLVRHIVRQKRK